ncbi:uncharacterized protein BDW43DRAFT_292804 [Aspergillus alliaceus]|uniref:uncharacterized protein n=1 Tax=Petromyces alliaceus TaxID=209559 RepID=UPI0012A589B4|nr:uncharacterized protein BDW43DRAFT_292804 [Aspergillus alliaceus]KAB8227914.1 hypothetical protein BDW43DRAFT_292804 [Aspergillus alliaceus]
MDVFNALRGRAAGHTYIDYPQGYDRFHEDGLHRPLPIEEEQKIDVDPCLVTKATETQQAQSDDDIKRLRREYSILKRRISSSRLQQYQSQWHTMTLLYKASAFRYITLHRHRTNIIT